MTNALFVCLFVYSFKMIVIGMINDQDFIHQIINVFSVPPTYLHASVVCEISLLALII